MKQYIWYNIEDTRQIACLGLTRSVLTIVDSMTTQSLTFLTFFLDYRCRNILACGQAHHYGDFLNLWFSFAQTTFIVKPSSLFHRLLWEVNLYVFVCEFLEIRVNSYV